jgi:LysM domain
MKDVAGKGTYHEVQQGDCLSSIADQYGLSPKTVWDHPENSQLKRDRKDPNVLCPGDELFIPALELKTESGATEQKHRFRKKNTPAKVRLRLLDDQFKPRANVKYKLQIDGLWHDGSTDADGKIEYTIPPSAKDGLLVIENECVIPLALGGLDPVGTDHGVKQRLNNLGYECDGSVEVWEDESLSALHAFQTAQGLNLTAEPDQPTRDKLVQAHGS